MKTIIGNCDSNGLFTARLTYATNRIIPPLFCYNENNELVKGVEGVEVKGPVWQYKNYDKWLYYPEKELFVNYAEYKAFMNNTDIETRQIYIAVQPTEKAEIGESPSCILKSMSDKYYEAAYAIIEPEVERLARFVLANNKRIVDEFMMAMGTYCFIKKGDVLWDHQWEKCIGIKELENFISDHDNEFKITGIPMRFKNNGLKITHW